MYRGNRYRYANEYGTMLLFDSNGRITGMQVAVNMDVTKLCYKSDCSFYILLYLNRIILFKSRFILS